MSNTTSYSLLIRSLDRFIRKYYLSKILRGFLLFLALNVALFLIYTFFEGQYYFPKGVRKLMFYSFVVISLSSLIYWVVWPLLKYFRLGQTISHEQAAKIVGSHFTNVQDKLLNVLQLKHQSTGFHNELIEASINQKSDQIRLVPFSNAIDLNKNRKYLKYAVPPMLLLLLFLFTSPKMITSSTWRIINNDKEFEREAPFQFLIQNEELSVLQFEDFVLQVSIEGEMLPAEIFVHYDNYDYKMTDLGDNRFSYTFSNVRENKTFEVFSGKYREKEKELHVITKPRMLNLDLKLDYPSYTNLHDESISNRGDFTVPQGTRAEWIVTTIATDHCLISFDQGKDHQLDRLSAHRFGYSQRLMSDQAYSIQFKNKNVTGGDSLQFLIKVIKDAHPQISVDQIKDSTSQVVSYYVGSCTDDYGIESLSLVYTISNDQGQTIQTESKPITIDHQQQVDFEYLIDIREYDLKPGQSISYYFETYDNDRVNGSKSARTAAYSYRMRSLDEIKDEEQLNEEEIKDKLDKAIAESQDLQEELQKLREKLLQKEEPDWQDKKQLDKLMQREESMQQQLQEALEAHQQNMQHQQQFMETNPQTQEKQDRMKKLFDELMDDEMKELMKEIRELMDELNKEQAIQKMEDFKMNEETKEKELERLKELYKQLEVEKEANELMKDLEKLSEEQKDLSEKTEEQTLSQEELMKEQEEINKKNEELKKKMSELLKKNSDLEYPKKLPQDAPEQMEDIQHDLDNSSEQLQQENNDNASEKQKTAAKKMKKLASQMQQQMSGGEQEQMQEDIETLRQLLENLVTLSYDQEDLFNAIGTVTTNTPRYSSLLQDQLKVKDDFRIVEDTLLALSKRQPKVETFVLEKVAEINQNLDHSMERLEDRKKPEANKNQRITMTNMNDLALMLSETMQQMQQQMAQGMPGSQMCENPGQGSGSKPGRVPMDKITKGQEEMSEELKKMSEGLKKGKGNNARSFAEAAARQAALRKALEKMQQELQESGHGVSNELQKIIDEMDKQEIDLVNKRLDNEMLLRQQEIMTRLLEAEKAQKEREYDEQRESRQGQNFKREVPPSLQEYIKQRKAQIEQYQYTTPEVRQHYKDLINHYYQRLKKAS